MPGGALVREGAQDYYKLRTLDEMLAEHERAKAREAEPKPPLINNSALLKKLKERSNERP